MPTSAMFLSQDHIIKSFFYGLHKKSNTWFQPELRFSGVNRYIVITSPQRLTYKLDRFSTLSHVHTNIPYKYIVGDRMGMRFSTFFCWTLRTRSWHVEKKLSYTATQKKVYTLPFSTSVADVQKIDKKKLYTSWSCSKIRFAVIQVFQAEFYELGAEK